MIVMDQWKDGRRLMIIMMLSHCSFRLFISIFDELREIVQVKSVIEEVVCLPNDTLTETEHLNYLLYLYLLPDFGMICSSNLWLFIAFLPVERIGTVMFMLVAISANYWTPIHSSLQVLLPHCSHVLSLWSPSQHKHTLPLSLIDERNCFLAQLTKCPSNDGSV